MTVIQGVATLMCKNPLDMRETVLASLSYVDAVTLVECLAGDRLSICVLVHFADEPKETVAGIVIWDRQA